MLGIYLTLFYTSLSFAHLKVCGFKLNWFLKTIELDKVFFWCWSGFPSGRRTTHTLYSFFFHLTQSSVDNLQKKSSFCVIYYNVGANETSINGIVFNNVTLSLSETITTSLNSFVSHLNHKLIPYFFFWLPFTFCFEIYQFCRQKH
jgi:hypothetical protein